MLGSAKGSQFADGLDVLLGDVDAVLGAQQVLGQHLEAVGEFLGAGHRIESVDLVAVIADLQGVVLWLAGKPISGYQEYHSAAGRKR